MFNWRLLVIRISVLSASLLGFTTVANACDNQANNTKTSFSERFTAVEADFSDNSNVRSNGLTNN